MPKMPRWYRERVTVRLYRTKKAVPKPLWLLPFLVCCLVLPFAMGAKIAHPGTLATLEAGMAVAATDPVHGVVFVSVMLALGGWLKFSLDAAFVFLRAAAGYEVRKNGSILAWVFRKLKAWSKAG